MSDLSTDQNEHQQVLVIHADGRDLQRDKIHHMYSARNVPVVNRYFSVIN
jgi:hypothetical protein